MYKKGGHRSGGDTRSKVTVYERVTERITQLLRQGVVPWQKPWNAHVGPPRNGVSGKYYRGLNVFLLSTAGFDSPWWFSPKQVNDLDGHIRKGEKVSWAHFFKPWIPKGELSEASEIDADEAEVSTRRRPILIIRAYRVVNLEQCAGPGIDKFRAKHPVEGPAKNDNDPIAACEQMVAGMPHPPSVRFGGDRACYWPAADQISMPKRETFVGSEAYYSTLFHELTHSTRTLRPGTAWICRGNWRLPRFPALRVGCGCECLDTIECNCTREIYACEECLDSDITLVCGDCRDRAHRVIPLRSYPCRDFQDDEAGPGRDMGGRLPVRAPVGAWGPPYRAV